MRLSARMMISTILAMFLTPILICVGSRAYIYALIDPRTDEVRYIGKALRPTERFSGHIRDCRKHPRTQWIQGLRRNGLVPKLSILEGPCEDWSTAEKKWIAHYLSQGARLTNLTDGGEGVGTYGWWLGKKMSAEARKKMSKSGRNRPKSQQHRQAISDALLGHAPTRTGPHTGATKKRIADAKRADRLYCDLCGKTIGGGNGNLVQHQRSGNCRQLRQTQTSMQTGL